MIRSFRLISILFVILVFASCSKGIYPLKTGDKAIVEVSDKVQKYNMKLDFMKKQFDGVMVVRKMDDGEIRIVSSTLFGLSLFDFGIKDELWTVYSCLQPMHKEGLLKLLEQDFKLLFLPDRDVKKIETKKDYTKFVSGKGFTSCVTKVSPIYGTAEYIKVNHWKIGLSITLEKLKE